MSKPASPRKVSDKEALAVGTMIRGSARKLNLVAGLIRGRKVEEALNILKFSPKAMSEDVYKVLGIRDHWYRLSLGDPNDKEKYVDNPEMWARGEAYLKAALARIGVDYVEAPGEAAFYGPKADFIVRDCIGRQWQLGTVQLDLQMPKRFGLTYQGDDNAEHTPAMIHRALLGSLERFVGVYLEHTGGDLPLVLAPEQVRILPVADVHVTEAESLADRLRSDGFRVRVDEREETVARRIRDAERRTGRHWNWLPGRTMTPAEEHSLAEWKDTFYQPAARCLGDREPKSRAAAVVCIGSVPIDAMAAPVVGWGAWPFHRAAWKNFRHGAATMDTLISVGTSSAFAWSVYALFWGDAGTPGMKMGFKLAVERGAGRS